MWPMDAYPPPIMPLNLFLLNTNIFKYICIIIETWSINTNLPPTLLISVSILYYIYWQPFIQSTLTGWSTHSHSGVVWECFWGHSLTLVHSETSLLLNLIVTTKCRTVKWMQLLLKTSDEWIKLEWKHHCRHYEFVRVTFALLLCALTVSAAAELNSFSWFQLYVASSLSWGCWSSFFSHLFVTLSLHCQSLQRHVVLNYSPSFCVRFNTSAAQL